MVDVVSMHVRLGVMLWLACCLAQGCASNSSRMRTVGAMTSVDTSVRRTAFERGHGGRVDGNRVARLEGIVRKFTRANWNGPTIRVAILASHRPNAYVLASGDLYATLGLFDVVCTDDELAAVVAHELAHLEDLRSFSAVNLTPDERLDIESRADAVALGMLVAAGYQATALTDMVNRLANDQPDGWAQHRCDELSALLNPTADVEIASAESSAIED